MTVYELYRDQIDELKETMYYHIGYNAQYDFWDDIPDTAVFSEYEHFTFNNDDFFCTSGK